MLPDTTILIIHLQLCNLQLATDRVLCVFGMTTAMTQVLSPRLIRWVQKKAPLARGAYLLNLIYEIPLSRVSASTRWAKCHTGQTMKTLISYAS